MNVKISAFVICVGDIIWLLLYNLHDCTFNVFKANKKSHKNSVSDVTLVSFNIFITYVKFSL